ncbi:MAG: DUF1501 domain-containing protein [Cytophagales bacterium]|jgi:uncharacterized protein (DUF1501 family)|nr:DUF1501 domain-containing protein [Cytophagales bacterium]
MKRRNFLSKSALATAGTMLIPNFLKAFERQHLNSRVLGERKLVIVQLSGGNDGLNTVVPHRNDVYYRLRPQLAVEAGKVLTLNDEMGLNPAMTGLKQLYDDGLLSVLNSVGYPNPDRSHFRSMDIWQTGSAAEEYWQTGWVGRYLDAACGGTCTQPYDAVEVDDTLSLALKGERLKGLAVPQPQKLHQLTHEPLVREISVRRPPDDHEHETVGYLYKTLGETVSSAAYLYDKSKIYKSKADYPNTDLGRKLRTVAELILSGVETSVFYVSMTGFDTHVGQKQRQETLLKQYADAMRTFVYDLRQNNRLDETLVMTFSEFGRRVAQNASNGTDHGTANNVFLAGGKLAKPGLFNAAPDLQNLDAGDLRFQVDFRDIYATLLRDWLRTDDTTILGRRMPGLKLV